MIPKIERDFVAADLAAVEALLAQMTKDDVLTASSLESRRDELCRTLAELEAAPETAASAALFFSGRPVIGSRGIEAEFGADAASGYQDIVTKMFAHRRTGRLGQRGVVPGTDLSKLYITNIVHGSFGFRLEELAPQTELVGSVLKDAVDAAARVMVAFGEPDEDTFLTAMSNLDARVIDSVRKFFDLIRERDAAFRLVSGDIDRSFDGPAVARAAERAQGTRIQENEENFDGTLAGVLPEGRRFEYRTGADRGTISGMITPDLGDTEVAGLNQKWLDQPSHARVLIRRVTRDGRILRESFMLMHLTTRAGEVKD